MQFYWRYSILILLLLSFEMLNAQESDPTSDDNALSDLITAGNNLLSRGSFASATGVWEQVANQDAQNANAHFKLGICYRNAIGNEEKALDAFRHATKSMSLEYDFSSSEERNAPYDALFFLGEAYLNNDLPDSALEQFIQYQGYYMEETPITTDRHILYCINAKRMKKSLRDVNFIDAGGSINTSFNETHPVATLDDNLLFFSSRRPTSGKDEARDKRLGQYDQDIYVSTRQGTAWTNATLFDLSTDANEVPLAISKDGLTFYFRSDEGGKQNIYSSEFEGGVWRKAQEVEGNVNSKANESSFSISEDGTEIYFTSDREEGIGGSDIYMVKRKSNGKWGRPENIGRTINTEQNERAVFIHPTGNTLFWSSNGYLGKGMGGYDIYYSTKQEDGSWGEPQNLGYPINTTGDDLYYYIGGGGKRYYARYSDETTNDVYEVTGGGFEFENLELGTEVVTLTQEMEVAEILEVEKEVQTEVEVLDLSILDEFDTDDEDEVEEIDLTDLGEEEEELNPEDLYIDLNVNAIDMDRLDSLDQDSLVTLVQNWLESQKEAEEEVLEEKEITFSNSGTITFRQSSRGISSESAALLDEVAKQLKSDEQKKVALIGHTDDSGDWTINFKISRERAWEAYKYLLRQGVKRSQMIWYGKGSTDPIAPNTTDEGRAKNRRVDIVMMTQ